MFSPASNLFQPFNGLGSSVQETTCLCRRQGTSSQYQNSYLDLAVCVAQKSHPASFCFQEVQWVRGGNDGHAEASLAVLSGFTAYFASEEIPMLDFSTTTTTTTTTTTKHLFQQLSIALVKRKCCSDEQPKPRSSL